MGERESSFVASASVGTRGEREVWAALVWVALAQGGWAAGLLAGSLAVPGCCGGKEGGRSCTVGELSRCINTQAACSMRLAGWNG